MKYRITMKYLKTYENYEDDILYDACNNKSKNTETIRLLLKSGAKITKEIFRNAIINNKIRTVKDFLDTGWNPSRVDLEESLKDYNINYKISKYLLEKGAPLPKLNNIERYIYFLSYEKIELLLDYNFDFTKEMIDQVIDKILTASKNKYNLSITLIEKIFITYIEIYPQVVLRLREVLPKKLYDKYEDLIESYELGLL